MKKFSLLFSSFVCFTILPELLLALPKDHSVIAGDVTIQNQNAHTMVIKASDRAIVDYKSFDIHKGEKVQFIQPSSSSTVLNRVRLKKGDKASKILGQLESNGKVLLVNPNGIYFGPHASVRVGSLIASALDIANDDFIKDQYSFLLTNKDYLAEIRNDGLLSASPEGAIVLMAPIIRNLGTIQASAGKVVLAAGERVTLDFHGDNLLHFTVEGDLKGAVIQHLGLIQAEGGEVSMRLPTAKRAIHEVVNRDGLEKGEVFVKENGEIFLVSASSIRAKKVSLEGSCLSVDGNIDVSNESGKGGEVCLSGAEINLHGARIDASGWSNGGEVLIGGEYQGKGSMPYASSVSMDSTSHVLANAIEEGDGGNVVLWSLNQTEFEGNIFAQGGFQSGNGGSVETSSMENLQCLNGYVNTFAASGNMGQWLLDPSVLYIVAGSGAGPSSCTSGLIGVDSFTSSTSNVTLCANAIHQQVPITMTSVGAGLVFTAPSGESGVLYLEGGDIITSKGTILVQNLASILENSIEIDTTGGGVFAIGASISLETVNSDSSGAKDLTINSGLAVFEADNMGLVNPLGEVSVSAGLSVVQSIITQSSPITFDSSILLNGDAIFNTAQGSAGADISLRLVDGIIAGGESLIIRAGIGAVSVGVVGSSNPLKNFSILSAAPLVSVGNIITQNGAVNIVPSIVLTTRNTTIKTVSELNTLLSGNITLGDVTAPYENSKSLIIESGLKGRVTLGDIGTSDIPFLDVIISTNQALSLAKVYAENLTVGAESGIATFNDDILLSGRMTVTAAEIFLGGDIVANNVSLVSRNSIFNKSTPNVISTTTDFPGLVYLNASRGQIGSSVNYIELDTEGAILLGGNPIYVELTGTTQEISYVNGNKPCLVSFRGATIPCAAARMIIFNALPKSAFRLFFMNPINLGIGYPAIDFSDIQFSPFAPITAISGYLPQV